MMVYALLVWLFSVGLKLQGGTYEIANVISDLKLAVGASTLSVNHTLRNALTVEMCQQIDQVEILHQKRAVGTNALRSLGIHDLYIYG